jgi:transposase-like protein
MSKRIRRRFTEEFKARAVAMVVEQGQSVSRICTDLDLVESALRRWIDEAKGVASQGKRLPAAVSPVTSEHAELQQLRRENQILRMEREILKKATAFFAKEST